MRAKRLDRMKITHRYALSLSVLLASAEGTGWEYEETDESWWAIRLWVRRN